MTLDHTLKNNYAHQKEVHMKKCNRCGELLDMALFHRNNSSRDGLQSMCKKCKSIVIKEWRATDKGKLSLRKASKKYRANHPDKVFLWKENNRDKLNAYAKKYYRQDRQKFLARAKNRTITHPNQCKFPTMVKNAVRDKKIFKPKTCLFCKQETKIEAHHWSYEDGHALDIIWVCKKCHVEFHKGERRYRAKFSKEALSR